jgi:hypothetical protein
MSKQEIILLPKIQHIDEFFSKNQIFICSCCDLPSEITCFSNKKNKCAFCNLNDYSKKTTLIFTFKNFIYNLKISKLDFLDKLIKILSKYKFINANMEMLVFFINFKNINLDNYSCFENYLISFFEETFEFLNIKNNFKIEKSKFCSSYITAINKFAKEKKRPLGRRILMPCFNIEYKISKRELINLKNILV